MVVPLVLAARRVRRRIVPAWTGALGGLADAVLTFSALCAITQLLGSVGLFRADAITPACVAVGLAVLLVVRPAPALVIPRGPKVPLLEVAAATAAVGLLAGPWVTWVARGFDYGISNSDSVW